MASKAILLYQGVYTLQICTQNSRSGLGENQCHGHITDVHHDSGLKNSSGLMNSEKTRIFTNISYNIGIQGYSLSFIKAGVYDLQILHTASLVGQY